MYQLALYASDSGSQEYVIIIDLDDPDARPSAFIRKGFKLRELVEVDADLIAFPVGEELRKV